MIGGNRRLKNNVCLNVCRPNINVISRKIFEEKKKNR